MMNSMIKENGVTFKKLEKNIFLWVCQIGQQFTQEFLERYDQMLMKERDKSKYRHKGLCQTIVNTVYGEVTYRRAIYEVIQDVMEMLASEEVDEMFEYLKIYRDSLTDEKV